MIVSLEHNTDAELLAEYVELMMNYHSLSETGRFMVELMRKEIQRRMEKSDD